MADLAIRRAQVKDAPALLTLLDQLGYPAQADELRGRLGRLLATADGDVLVAESAGALTGLVSFQVFELIYHPRPQCRLTALVVNGAHRRRGIGSSLLAAVEGIARERGCSRLELTTRRGRPDALPFYTSLGFTERRHRLVKGLE